MGSEQAEYLSEPHFPSRPIGQGECPSKAKSHVEYLIQEHWRSHCALGISVTGEKMQAVVILNVVVRHPPLLMDQKKVGPKRQAQAQVGRTA